MNKRMKPRYTMTDEDLKALKKSLEYVRKLNIFNETKQENISKIKKVA